MLLLLSPNQKGLDGPGYTVDGFHVVNASKTRTSYAANHETNFLEKEDNRILCSLQLRDDSTVFKT